MPHIDDLNDAVLRGMALQDAWAVIRQQRDALMSAKSHIAYQHLMFGETERGNRVLAQIRAVLAQKY